MKNITYSKSALFDTISLNGVNSLFNLVLLCLGKVILGFLHHLYSFILLINEYYVQTVSFISNRTTYLKEVPIIEREVSFLTKLPSHLVLILGPESPSYVDLVKIIVWCFPARITHISFFDHNNSIDPQRLFDAVSLHGKNYIPKIKWGKSFSEDIKLFSRGLINGYSWNPLLHVHVYRREDGLESMVENVKFFNGQGVDHVNQGQLDAIMRKQFDAPDPDLAVVCGPALSSYGFPPWHLRITLMQIITSHHNISVFTFLWLLHQYSRSEQRYGK